MNKITIEYNIEDSFGKQEVVRVLKAGEAYSVLWDLDQWLRNLVKHGEDGLATDTYESCRNRLHSLMNEAGVSFEEYS